MENLFFVRTTKQVRIFFIANETIICLLARIVCIPIMWKVLYLLEYSRTASHLTFIIEKMLTYPIINSPIQNRDFKECTLSNF